ncbi:MAG TPA: hypothetical protein VEX86_00760 [Longimicrobium sp.]|nr:hypothetical protein [Longimicrobium sp.]
MRDPSWMQLSDELRRKEAQPLPGAAPAAVVGQPGQTATPVVDRPYAYAWDEYRALWRRLWFTSGVGWLTIAGLVWLLPQVGAENVLAALFPIWGLAWVASSMYVGMRIVFFPCPRCAKTFFKPFMSTIFQYKCRSCGLRKLAVDDRPSTFLKVP